jgi:hypothetical protein
MPEKQDSQEIDIGTAELSSTSELERNIAVEIKEKIDANQREEWEALEQSSPPNFVRWF